MKKILIFLGEEICYNSINIFSQNIGKFLGKHGWSAEYSFFGGLDEDALAQSIVEARYDAVIAINAFKQQVISYRGENLWDYLGIPFFDYIVDHPIRHDTPLKMEFENHRVICIDREHTDFIRRYYKEVKSADFLPLPGIRSKNAEHIYTEEDFRSRRFDLVFAGSRYSLSSMEENILHYPEMVRKLLVQLIERLLAYREETYETALKAVLKDSGIDAPDDPGFLKMLVAVREASSYVCAYVREEVVRYLMASGIRFDLFGNGWEEIAEDGGSHTTIHTGISYEETAGLFESSKIVLNVMPWFRDGCHDRIAMGMLNGAVVCTDGSGYLKECFSDDNGEGSLLTYSISHPEEVPAMVERALKDMGTAYRIAENGRKEASLILSPEAHGERLAGILNRYCS